MRIAAIRRSSEFSPNSEANDDAVFSEMVMRLKLAGHGVTEYSEPDFVLKYDAEPVVVHMARRAGSLQKLKELEANGCFIINSPAGIANCGRVPMTQLLLEAGIVSSDTIIHAVGASTGYISDSKIWVKRGDGHSMCRADVCLANNRAELLEALTEMAGRGVGSVVLSPHAEGDLVKFYGVSGTGFFHWFYPDSVNHSKFGLEAANGISRGISFSEKELETLCRKAADILHLSVWGGDVIVSPDGKIHLIDFNDFPSFRPCREAATTAIALLVNEYAYKSNCYGK